MAEWITIAQAAKTLGCSRAKIHYYVNTSRIEHRHTFTREGKRTEVQLPAKITKADHGSLMEDVKFGKCEECR